VRLFELDPDLLNRTPGEIRKRLQRVTVPVERVPAGSWEPRPSDEETLLTFIVVEGLLTRDR
jgi:hypothetical protein